VSILVFITMLYLLKFYLTIMSLLEILSASLNELMLNRLKLNKLGCNRLDSHQKAKVSTSFHFVDTKLQFFVSLPLL